MQSHTNFYSFLQITHVCVFLYHDDGERLKHGCVNCEIMNEERQIEKWKL